METAWATKGRNMRRPYGKKKDHYLSFCPHSSAVCPSGFGLEATAVETCISCNHDEWSVLRMGCHDKNAGTRYADTSILRAYLHIISLPGLAWLVFEIKGVLTYTESEWRFYLMLIVFFFLRLSGLCRGYFPNVFAAWQRKIVAFVEEWFAVSWSHLSRWVLLLYAVLNSNS